MTDPIADYEAFLKTGESKKALAIEALKKTLKDQKRAVRMTEQRIAKLEGRAPEKTAAPDVDGAAKPRKKSSYVMTPEHAEKMRIGREKLKAEKAKELAGEKAKK